MEILVLNDMDGHDEEIKELRIYDFIKGTQ